MEEQGSSVLGIKHLLTLPGSKEFFLMTGAAEAQGKQFGSAASTAAVNKRPATAATAASLMTRRMALRFRCSSLK